MANKYVHAKYRVWTEKNKLDLRQLKQLINLQRQDINTVRGVLSVHCHIANHADEERCFNSHERAESITHLLYTWTAMI